MTANREMCLRVKSFLDRIKFLPISITYRIKVYLYSILFLSVLFCLILPCMSSYAFGLRSVVLDPGHGGEDAGCIGQHGTLEKDITLQMAKRLSQILEERLEMSTVLTRRGDFYLSTIERTGIANHSRSDLFLSLHANSTSTPGQTGQIMIFVSLPAGYDVESDTGSRGLQELDEAKAIPWDLVQTYFQKESFRLAGLIAEESRKSGLWREAVIKNAPILVLKGLGMPGVEIEMDFLTSSQGEERLKDPWQQEKICEVFYRAIIRFGATSEQLEGDPNETTW